MNASELRNKTESELVSELYSLSKEQFSLRMQKGSGQQVKSSQFKCLRKDMARINTVLAEIKRGTK
ncbi:MAG: 50S ribosomal protein L29 [Methylomonas sp.]|nr:50S ribosomal protein L29 [Methylomonas sp.]PPD36670.1 MAG: 50S ribosomal protein L29 [Methylomonas sp.]PPD52256.1 MAG: 50S ribosomal protein L29 [Methylotenera sp.]